MKSGRYCSDSMPERVGVVPAARFRGRGWDGRRATVWNYGSASEGQEDFLDLQSSGFHRTAQCKPWSVSRRGFSNNHLFSRNIFCLLYLYTSPLHWRRLGYNIIVQHSTAQKGAGRTRLGRVKSKMEAYNNCSRLLYYQPANRVHTPTVFLTWRWLAGCKHASLRASGLVLRLNYLHPMWPTCMCVCVYLLLHTWLHVTTRIIYLIEAVRGSAPGLINFPKDSSDRQILSSPN